MFGVLINKEGYKIVFDVLSAFEEIELKEDEQIIEKDWAIANSMNKPKWDFDKEIWEETEPKEVENEEVDKTKICTMEDLQEENEDLKKKYEQLLDTTQFLLKNTGFIPKEVDND